MRFARVVRWHEPWSEGDGRRAQGLRAPKGSAPMAAVRGMNEAGEILQSYLGLLGRLTGAGSVSLYVPPAVSGAREILVHEGSSRTRCPSSGRAQAAAEFHRRFGARIRRPAMGAWPAATPRACSTGSRCAGRRRDAKRRPAARSAARRDGRPAEPTAWIGLRFDPDGAERGARAAVVRRGRRRGARRELVEGLLRPRRRLRGSRAQRLPRVSSIRSPSCPSGPTFQAALEAALAHGPGEIAPRRPPAPRAGRLRLGQRPARPPLGRPGPARDRDGAARRAPQPRPHRALRGRDLLRHPPRHDARGRADGGGERGAPPAGPSLPRRDPASGVQRGPGGGRDRRAAWSSRR